MSQKMPLPVDDVLNRLAAALRDHAAAVLCAPPGAGKTTRVPPALLAAGAANGERILVLQPRRVAARATATRMASENQWQLGREIGYQIRFQSCVSRQSRIVVATEGVLLNKLRDDPFLTDIGLIVFDEFHERNLNSDLALSMVRQVQQSVRPELKILVMSATLAAEPVAQYLDDCPIIRCQGKPHPVTIRYVAPRPREPIAESAASAVQQLLPSVDGDILVFLPGLHEIRETRRQLASSVENRDLQLLELYGDLPADRQDAVLVPCRKGKVILSTNVAETSLTIDGITAVVDSGWARILRFAPNVGLDRLQREPISQASADQRAGRAGRTRPGICVRLWDERAHTARPAFEQAEIRRIDLTTAVLQLKCWIEPKLDDFPWFEAPRPQAVQAAVRLLTLLDALDSHENVTPLGRRIAQLPIHPRLGRLLIAAQQYGCTQRGALTAAILSERSPFLRDTTQRRTSGSSTHTSNSDVLDEVNTLGAFARGSRRRGNHTDDILHTGRAKTIFRVRDQLLARMGKTGTDESSQQPAAKSGELLTEEEDQALLRCLLAAFGDRLARRRVTGSPQGVMVGGRGVRLAAESAVREAMLFLCIDVQDGDRDALVRKASAVDPAWLPAEHRSIQVDVLFDEVTERVVARRRSWWVDLLLEESPAALPDGPQTAAVLAAAAQRSWHCIYPPDDPDTSDFVARVQCLADWLPELELPTLDDSVLQDLLPGLCAGRRSFVELRKAPWLATIRGMFRYQQLREIDREAPSFWKVPGGRQVPIRYEVGQPPLLAARIQELFGANDTPRIARGRVRLLLHLLAPNMRPQQITDDLQGFWKNSYAEVRKQLRGRYPKHDWPELGEL